MNADIASRVVSIVVPTYNRAHLVTRAVDSALAQSYPHIEVVVVDDGSFDETPAMLQRYCGDRRVRVITHPANRGVAAAKNTGLDAVSGGFATILDSDDELVADAVATLMQAFDRLGPQFGMVFANCLDATTGAWTGRGLDTSTDVSFADAVTGRFQGEFWGIWRMSALGARRFDATLNGGESLVWHDMYRSTRVHYVHAALRRYQRASPDSVSRAQQGRDELARTRGIYEAYLRRFGDDLLRLDRRIYARYLQSIAIWHIMAGERGQALRHLGQSVRIGRNLRQTLLSAAIAVTPAFVLRRVVAHRRSR